MELKASAMDCAVRTGNELVKSTSRLTRASCRTRCAGSDIAEARAGSCRGSVLDCLLACTGHRSYEAVVAEDVGQRATCALLIAI